MSEWKEVRLGELVDINKSTYSIRDKWDYVSYLDTGNITNGIIDTIQLYEDINEIPSRARRKVSKNDIIYSCVRPNQRHYGFMAEPIDNLLVSTGFATISAKQDKANAKYLYYYLIQNEIVEYLQNIGEQAVSTYPTIKPSDISNIELTIPSLELQSQIADILSSLDAKIETNNKLNEKLEEMAQAIFKSWLSDCDETISIGELSQNITDYSKVNKENVILINSSDVTNGFFDHHNYSENKNIKGHFKKRFYKGDILYSQVRPRNRHWAYCYFDADDYIASTQLMVIRNNEEELSSLLLYQYLISDRVWNEFTLKTETRSGTFPQGNYEDLSKICVPYKKDNKSICKTLETIYNGIYKRYEENQRLASLRDTLLPRLMSGEIKI